MEGDLKWERLGTLRRLKEGVCWVGTLANWARKCLTKTMLLILLLFLFLFFFLFLWWWMWELIELQRWKKLRMPSTSVPPTPPIYTHYSSICATPIHHCFSITSFSSLSFPLFFSFQVPRPISFFLFWNLLSPKACGKHGKKFWSVH